MIAIFAILFFISSVFFIFNSGWMSCTDVLGSCSLKISEYHAHDAFWHLAISEVAFHSFPPIHPLFSGAMLTHYNYLYDFLVYLFSKYSGISSLHSYFHVFPVLISLLYIMAVLKTLETHYHNGSSRLFTALLLFLGNSYAFIMTLFTSNTLAQSSLRGYPLVLSLQPTTMFLNSQFALSLPIILFAILFITSKKSIHPVFKCVVLCVLIVFLTLLKAYAGITLLTYSLCYFILQFLKKPNSLSIACIFVSISSFFAVSLAFGGGKGVFSYDPLAFIRSLFDDPNHFFSTYIALARITLESTGRLSPRLILLYGTGILIFYLINFGSRIVFVFQIFGSIQKREINIHIISLLATILLLSIIPLLFVQKGDFFNTIQFLYYGVFLSSLIAGSVYANIQNSFVKAFFFIVIVITVCIPLVDQLLLTNNHNYISISSDFLNITKNLNMLPYGTVSLFGKAAPDGRISAFSGKQLTIADTPVLSNTFVDFANRLNEVKKHNFPLSTDYILVDKNLEYDWKSLLDNKLKISENKSFILLKN